VRLFVDFAIRTTALVFVHDTALDTMAELA
jgi:hypothetical protein